MFLDKCSRESAHGKCSCFETGTVYKLTKNQFKQKKTGRVRARAHVCCFRVCMCVRACASVPTVYYMKP